LKLPSLEEVDKRKLPNHQSDDCQEQSSIVMLDAITRPRPCKRNNFALSRLLLGMTTSLAPLTWSPDWSIQAIPRETLVLRDSSSP
jgi:hypothetical protein